MTEAIILRRLARPVAADRIILPGRCRADLAHLQDQLGVPVTRGPDELSDFPPISDAAVKQKICRVFQFAFLPKSSMPPRFRSTPCLLGQRPLRKSGADVIDIGCLPDTPFPHLEESVRALKAAGHKVSVNSAEQARARARRRGGRGFFAEPR